MKTASSAWRLAGTFVALIASSSPSSANIFIGTGGTPVELVLTLVDQKNSKLSYTLDLGVNAAAFYIQAQQDTGSSLFRTLDPATDSAFNAFITQANLDTTRWMVFGGGWGTPVQANFALYTTQTNNGVLADQQKYFDKFHAVASTDLVGNVGPLSNYFGSLNVAKSGVDIVQSNHNSLDNGSSVASKNAGNLSTYAMRNNGFSDGLSGDGDCIVSGLFCIGNPLGKSSWFYRITPALLDGDVDGATPVVVDEFDNLTADGYWGFIKDPKSSKYILSYTLTGSNPKSLVSTDAGRSRLSSVDYSAQFGQVRLLGAYDLEASAAVTAVPEPQAWGLMTIGLLAIAPIAARRRRAGTQAA